jgi:hypothetical protein
MAGFIADLALGRENFAMAEKNPDLTDDPRVWRDAEPESMDLIDFMQSSPLAEAIAAGEFELPERPREAGRDFTFEDEDLDG